LKVSAPICSYSLACTVAHYYKKKFTFYNNKSNLVCNLVMYMIALAFANNTFKNDFTCLEDIYKLVVPLESDRIRLQWKGS
jgi:hypothetical protein